MRKKLIENFQTHLLANAYGVANLCESHVPRFHYNSFTNYCDDFFAHFLFAICSMSLWQPSLCFVSIAATLFSMSIAVLLGETNR